MPDRATRFKVGRAAEAEIGRSSQPVENATTQRGQRSIWTSLLLRFKLILTPTYRKHGTERFQVCDTAAPNPSGLGHLHSLPALPSSQQSSCAWERLKSSPEPFEFEGIGTIFTIQRIGDSD